MHLITCNDVSFSSDVLESNIPVLVDFSAPWCGPCKILLPTLEELSLFFKDRLSVVKVDIEEAPLTATRYGIQRIPALVLFRDREIIDTKVGVYSLHTLKEWINPYLD